MTRFDPNVFRRYDIRGRAGEQISTDLAHAVGRGLGERIRENGGAHAAVGRDVRPSSPELMRHVARGFTEAGLDVHVLDVVPTPVLYHALHRLGLDGGVMVTGSHNPRSDNGLKMCLGTGPFWGDDITSLRERIEAGVEREPIASTGELREETYMERYLDELVDRFEPTKPFRIGVDAGNGVMGPVVLAAGERLGLEIVPLYCEPDGNFPNHLPDPEVPAYMEELGRTVIDRKLDLGLGFDGDGDRVGVFDETGRKISADWLIALYARDMLTCHPGGIVRFDVKCSSFLADDVRAHGGEPWMGETGHSILKRDVKERDAILGGELSGHIVFNRDYLPIDDSLYCALMLLRLAEVSGGPVSELFADFPDLHSTAEIKLPCPDERKFDVVAELVEDFRRDFQVIDVDGARVEVGDGAWFLVRASNTTPCLTVRFEARTRSDLEAARGILQRALSVHPVVDASPLG